MATSMGKASRIKKTSVADQVYVLLHEDIINERWKKGDRLPAESEIAAALGVNRLTVRLALQRLSTQGFVETRVGEGSFVIATSDYESISEFSKSYMADDITNDVMEFRSLIEPRCVELAVTNATDEEIDILEEYCVKYEKAQEAFFALDDDESCKSLVEADFQFHWTLCNISHNKLYAYSYSMAKEGICQYLQLIIAERDERKKKKKNNTEFLSVDGHRQLLNALRERDMKNCKRIIKWIVDYDKTM